MQTISFALSIIGLIFFIVALLLKGKDMRMILLMTFTGNIIMAVSYLTAVNGNNGAVLSLLGGVISLINYFFKDAKIPIWLLIVYAIILGTVNIVIADSWSALFTILAALAFIMSIAQKSGKKYRLWMGLNSLSWIAYDLVTMSYGPLTTHTILFACSLIGMIIHDFRQSKILK